MSIKNDMLKTIIISPRKLSTRTRDKPNYIDNKGDFSAIDLNIDLSKHFSPTISILTTDTCVADLNNNNKS